MYFERFPTTYYTLDDQKSVQTVRNIFLRIVINDSIKNNFSLFDEYDIVEGETPEIVADRFYRNPQYHWLILHMNDILDPRYDWPLTTNNLVKYCEGKYTNIYATHHYENENGDQVNSNYPNATAISNYTYEDRINESKRRIKILKPQYVEAVLREFTNKLEGING
jgi:hypothetical protein